MLQSFVQKQRRRRQKTPGTEPYTKCCRFLCANWHRLPFQRHSFFYYLNCTIKMCRMWVFSMQSSVYRISPFISPFYINAKPEISNTVFLSNVNYFLFPISAAPQHSRHLQCKFPSINKPHILFVETMKWNAFSVSLPSGIIILSFLFFSFLCWFAACWACIYFYNLCFIFVIVVFVVIRPKTGFPFQSNPIDSLV